MVYLDNNATTTVDACVQESIMQGLSHYANPSSLHYGGLAAAKDLAESRSIIAHSIGCEDIEIIFTSSGSESNNLCIKGYALANIHRGNHIITTSIEHPSILQSCKYLSDNGFDVTYLDVDSQGFVLEDQLRESLNDNTILVSITHANSEIGTIQPLDKLLRIIKTTKPDVATHVDMAQSYLKTKYSEYFNLIDMASFSGHKIHAPKGIGFVYKRNSITLQPIVHGGKQEGGLRAGTENIPYIKGLATAVSMYTEDDVLYVHELQSYLVSKLQEIKNIRINGPTEPEMRLCTNVNFSTDAMDGEYILKVLSSRGICVSTGSACSSRYEKTSHVLKAIKCPIEFIHGTIRIGLSKYNTKSEIDLFISELEIIINSKKSFRLFG
ncbi:cysteine desulfurase family protein [Paenibacillus sp. FSL L8-0340]|uniref:cysteine desulfurase family protein n=1 Tax=Paenibacillus sp. FSL L8-0340 TaxID=2954685 RepID=UPI0031581702